MSLLPRQNSTPEHPSLRIARAFHERYEELAPVFGYRTRTESAKPWDEVPRENRQLMIATVMSLLDDGVVLDPDRKETP